MQCCGLSLQRKRRLLQRLARAETRTRGSESDKGQRKRRPLKKIRTAGPDAPTGFEKDGMETKAEPGEKDEPGTRNVSEPRNLKRVSQHNMSYQTLLN